MPDPDALAELGLDDGETRMQRVFGLDLKIAMAILSLCSAGGGALIAVSTRAVHWEDRLEQLATVNAALDVRTQKLEATISTTTERRIKLAQDLAVLSGRIETLEAKQAWLGEFIRDSLMSTPGHGSRR